MYSVMKYISEKDPCLDVQSFGALMMAIDQPFIYDRRFKKYGDIAVGAWTKRWQHCSCRGASVSWCMHKLMDSLLTRCYKGVDHQWLFGMIVDGPRQLRHRLFLTRLTDVLLFSYPYREFSFVTNGS